MQLHTFEVVLNSSESPVEGDVMVPIGGVSDALVTVQGLPDVWAVWHVPVDDVQNLAAFPKVSVETVTGDPLHLTVKATADSPGKTLKLRVFVLGQ